MLGTDVPLRGQALQPPAGSVPARLGGVWLPLWVSMEAL